MVNPGAAGGYIGVKEASLKDDFQRGGDHPRLLGVHLLEGEPQENTKRVSAHERILKNTS